MFKSTHFSFWACNVHSLCRTVAWFSSVLPWALLHSTWNHLLQLEHCTIADPSSGSLHSQSTGIHVLLFVDLIHLLFFTAGKGWRANVHAWKCAENWTLVAFTHDHIRGWSKHMLCVHEKHILGGDISIMFALRETYHCNTGNRCWVLDIYICVEKLKIDVERNWK